MPRPTLHVHSQSLSGCGERVKRQQMLSASSRCESRACLQGGRDHGQTREHVSRRWQFSRGVKMPSLTALLPTCHCNARIVGCDIDRSPARTEELHRRHAPIGRHAAPTRTGTRGQSGSGGCRCCCRRCSSSLLRGHCSRRGTRVGEEEKRPGCNGGVDRVDAVPGVLEGSGGGMVEWTPRDWIDTSKSDADRPLVRRKKKVEST